MAKNDTVTLPRDEWTLISESGENITDMSAQNLGNHPIFIKATNGETAPTNHDGARMLNPGIAVKAEDLAALFVGVTGANRYYAISNSVNGSVSVDHA